MIADVGVSMGDEGKGRLIPEVVAELEESSAGVAPVGVVLKVNGGANSGHTAGGLKLNLMPAGVVCRTVDVLALGAGVVADPRKIAWEVLPLEAGGHDVARRLLIDERCMVSDLSHRLLDLAWEYYRENVLGETVRGSTGRGITPAFADEVGQFQLYYGDILDGRAAFECRLKERFERVISVIRHVCGVPLSVFESFFETLSTAELRANDASVTGGVFAAEEFDFHRFLRAGSYALEVDRLASVYADATERWCDNLGDVREAVLATLASGRFVVGEFGQSFWLDKRHGFPPNVTASHTYTPEFFQSAGIPAQPVHTIGCCKAYDTKVGTHVFLTQMEDDHPLCAKLKQIEFGTSTGRQRMVGWFDAVEKGDALRYGGFDDLVFNKLDALTCDHDGPCELKICVGYQTRGGETLLHVPRREAARRQLKPVYKTVEGWREDISDVRSFGELPDAARRYVAIGFEALLRVAGRGQLPEELPNLRYIGVGPDPSQVIRDIPETVELLKLVR